MLIGIGLQLSVHGSPTKRRMVPGFALGPELGEGFGRTLGNQGSLQLVEHGTPVGVAKSIC